MSVEAVKWALYESPMLLTDKGRPDSTARQVLAVLAEHADRHGAEAYPSVSRIRYATGLDERTIQRALLRLERGGLTARDGFGPAGTVCWKLAMAVRRPETDWSALMVEVEEARRVESDRRRARRHRDSDALSGTENPGHADVRDAECRRPGRKIPASGTQSADVRDAAPPEPSFEPPLEPSMNHPLGAPLPPDPLRPKAPRSSGLWNEQKNSISSQPQQPPQAETASYDRAQIPHDTANPQPPTAEERKIRQLRQGIGYCIDCYLTGHTVLAADPVHGAHCTKHLPSTSRPTTSPGPKE